MKHEKSETFSSGGTVPPSQFAHGSPAENRDKKHEKSPALSTGSTVLWSQLA